MRPPARIDPPSSDHWTCRDAAIAAKARSLSPTAASGLTTVAPLVRLGVEEGERGAIRLSRHGRHSAFARLYVRMRRIRKMR